uniref:Uncharacterized protein n=1 Tax=Anguilla anguilla TaxID=7936 RepID=A0A0E9Q5Y3_ANGAN
MRSDVYSEVTEVLSKVQFEPRSQD